MTMPTMSLLPAEKLYPASLGLPTQLFLNLLALPADGRGVTGVLVPEPGKLLDGVEIVGAPELL